MPFPLFTRPRAAKRTRRITSLKFSLSDAFCLETLEINLIWNGSELLEQNLQQEGPIVFQVILVEIYYIVSKKQMPDRHENYVSRASDFQSCR